MKESNMGIEDLFGKRIQAIVRLPKLADELGWHTAPICIIMEDGTKIFASRDEEGNDAGELFLQNTDGDIQMFL
jgi:hypothetical protein